MCSRKPQCTTQLRIPPAKKLQCTAVAIMTLVEQGKPTSRASSKPGRSCRRSPAHAAKGRRAGQKQGRKKRKG
jgi:hypothetical protein